MTSASPQVAAESPNLILLKGIPPTLHAMEAPRKG